MKFEGEPLGFYGLIMGDISWRIFGKGEIDGRTGEELEEFLNQNDVPLGSTLILHSDGGNLFGGMSLGRVIRGHLLQVYVGRKGEDKGGYAECLPGHCMSAATIAFLGGEFRSVGQQNKFGVHRFTIGNDERNGTDSAQVLSATIVEYIRSMDVDIELFSLASETSADEILIIPEETLARLNVVNNGRKKPKWSIETIPEILYLKGEQETAYGINKFLILFPVKGDVELYIIFDAGVNAEDAMKMGTDRLVLDGKYIPMSDYRLDRINDHGRINVRYALSQELIDKIGCAKRVGMSFQWFEESATFLGFDNMPFEEGAAKLRGLLAIYRRNSS